MVAPLTYDKVVDVFNEYSCELLTTRNEVENSESYLSDQKYRAIMKCGHEKLTNIRQLRKNQNCTDCNNKLTAEKRKESGAEMYDLYNKGFAYIEKLANNDFVFEKLNCDGYGDFVYKPVENENNEWVKACLHTCKNKGKKGYNFKLNANIVNICVCWIDKLIWILIPEKDANTTISLGKSTKYYPYLVNTENIVNKLQNFYEKSQKLEIEAKILSPDKHYLYTLALNNKDDYSKFRITTKDRVNANEYGEVYRLVFPSGKSYIGQAVVLLSNGKFYGSYGRFKGHIHDSSRDDGGRCRLLNNAMRKYGKENIVLEILIVTKIENLTKYEDYFMALYNSIVPNGYNLREGGRCGRASEETINKLKQYTGARRYNFQQSPSQELRERISRTLVNNVVRHGHDGERLPKYIKYVVKKDRSGYSVIGYPKTAERQFVSKQLSLEEKKQLALDHLEKLVNES